ncbi:MAG: NADH dehydrogenase subunit [Elusimicrobia bacterium CG_4_9_14_3_um_filter_62_55]|nr:MAG: NADH dehydrogenase subunit [Elusimicrobia bacterium CG22_combo_CG10-13_8_21_14_all_63_91]PJA15800.1 MAG: NADH dehydrogenase subunit [Elusimicrobia bacterium CG_4_10_14_0_2_um_filter_63_34]PJB24892.1 MAG: NADH dehydrogenase subunit [Elusimicrobia bacterium CG_4_9_14_3_um_filter_62_55]
MLDGIEIMMEATGAPEGVIALKAKYEDLVALYEGLVKKREGIRFLGLGNFYPSGDEYSLVYEATGKLIPPGGIPIQIGAVVDNVETLLNVARAAKEPVTETWFSVAGAVARPCTLKVPVGTSFADALAMAGGPTVDDYAVLDGGAMMGKVVRDMSAPATKTTGGLIVLPADHTLITRKSASREVYTRIGKSACDQCSFCTEMCPRYLLGYKIEPHKVMRSLGFGGDRNKILSEWALLCCECSLCSLYACPESLDPRNICVSAKGDLRDQGVTWKNAQLNVGVEPKPHPMLEYRKIPLDRLIQRLGLAPFDADAPLIDAPAVKSVSIALKQHVGSPAVATVKAGDSVTKGQEIGRMPEGQLGAPVHASLSGKVVSVNGTVEIRG